MKRTLLFLIPTCGLCVLSACGGGVSNGGSGGPPPPTTYTFSVLYNFNGPQDGALPRSNLILDSAGNLYGTTRNGGPSDDGTVFKLDTNGLETVLHSFAAGEGAAPFGGLVRDASGNFYGTTFDGGDFGYGTVYRLNSYGSHTLLHSFRGDSLDGGQPLAGLVMDPAGNLYGTTSWGGTEGGGVLFKVDATGAESVLHNFTGEDAAGFKPWSSLILDSSGNFYGTNLYGGGAICECGTVFEMDPAGNATKLYAFTGNPVKGDASGPDAALPISGLVRDAPGNFYGATNQGGTAGLGTVYRIEPDGTELVLHSFTGGADDGEYPQQGSLLLDSKGDLYGTTGSGGSAGYGTVFMLDPAGKLTLLHSFNQTDGWYPTEGLVRDAAGNFYGTTEFGGSGHCTGDQGNAAGCGTVFKLTRN
jgi:uncharacterized repeat protein (TIGR03803 family)